MVLSVAQIAGATLFLGAIELALLYSGPGPHPPWVAALFVVGAFTYAGAGAVAWLRRPGSLMGLLMTGAAFVWLAAGLNNTTIPVLVAIGLIVSTVVIALVIHLLLAFPSGRLLDRNARLTVLAAYAVALIGQVPLYLFAAVGPLSVADRPDLVEAGHWVQRAAGALVVLSTCRLLARRLVELPPAQRRVLAPLSLCRCRVAPPFKSTCGPCCAAVLSPRVRASA